MKSSEVTILGLNDSNSAAAIIQNGQLIAMARQERFDRIKFSDAFPTNAVDYCLREAGIDIKEVDHIVFGWNPGHELEPQDSAAAIRYHKHFLHYIPNNLLRHVGGAKENKRITGISQTIDFDEGSLNLHFLPHHDCHAASAFFVSPFEKAAVMTIDGYGDDITHNFYIGNKNRLTPIGCTKYPHSLGQAYAGITQYLGYRANADEWKVMGLAAYGEPEYYDFFTKLIRFDVKSGEIKLDLDYFTFYIWHPRRYSDKFLKELGAERYAGEELTSRHKNIASSFQKRVEDVVLEMCCYLYDKTKINAICLAGGVMMNSKMNGRIKDESPFDDIWVQPSADDAGCSLGGCYLFWHQVLNYERSFVMKHDYWGAGFSNDQIKMALDDSLMTYQYVQKPGEMAAKAISENKIIAWFQGRMEVGQRALGNRSILADPRDPEMKDKINRLIKHREWYRPFTPSVLEEFQSEYFESEYPSSFMQMVYTIREEVRDKIPAVTHIDGTGRLQTVQKDINPGYWELIDEFRKITGVGLVLNTSFNDNDEPIVSTPKEALRTFFSTGLHELYIGNYVVRK